MLDVRRLTRSRCGGRVSRAMARLNARHPWSHNDHFHGWVLSRLPAQRRRALDVGCGRGELLAALAPRFDEVHGTDTDPGMRAAAAARCRGIPTVRVSGTPLADLDAPYDVVTMVAVLHHLDVEAALHDVRRLLAPGGRFLCVGLAPPGSGVDLAWDLASIVTNPLIGFVKHPRRSRRRRGRRPTGWQTPRSPSTSCARSPMLCCPVLGCGTGSGSATRSSGPRPEPSWSSTAHVTARTHVEPIPEALAPRGEGFVKITRG